MYPDPFFVRNIIDFCMIVVPLASSLKILNRTHVPTRTNVGTCRVAAVESVTILSMVGGSFASALFILKRQKYAQTARVTICL